MEEEKQRPIPTVDYRSQRIQPADVGPSGLMEIRNLSVNVLVAIGLALVALALIFAAGCWLFAGSTS
jgi:hypothetical protein